MSAQLELSIAAQGATDEEIGEATKELARWIGEAAPDCEVRPRTRAGFESSKDVIEVIGGLCVKLIEQTAVKSLMDCLATFIKGRRREVAIVVRTPQGGRFELKTGGVGSKELDELILRLSRVIAVSETESHA